MSRQEQAGQSHARTIGVRSRHLARKSLDSPAISAPPQPKVTVTPSGGMGVDVKMPQITPRRRFRHRIRKSNKFEVRWVARSHARMADLADALACSSGSNLVKVQVLFSAPLLMKRAIRRRMAPNRDVEWCYYVENGSYAHSSSAIALPPPIREGDPAQQWEVSTPVGGDAFAEARGAEWWSCM